MKAKIKNPLVFLFSILLIFLSCEKGSNETETSASVFKSRIVQLKDIPDIESIVTKQFAKSSYAESGSVSGALFDNRNVIETTTEAFDKTIITNYTVSFFYKDAPENIFYNLVINVLPTCEKQAYVLKFICDPVYFMKFKNSGYDFDHFYGVIEMYKDKDFTEVPVASHRSEADCLPVVMTYYGSNSGGPGAYQNTSSGKYNTVVIGYNSYPGVHTAEWVANGYANSITLPSSGGGAGVRAYWHHWQPVFEETETQNRDNSYNIEDCKKTEPPTGYVAISTAQQP